MKLQTKGEKRLTDHTFFGDIMPQDAKRLKIEKRISALVSQNPFPFL